MKKKLTQMTVNKRVISALNAANITGGYKRATQSDQQLTGCNTNCTAYDCSTMQKQ